MQFKHHIQLGNCSGYFITKKYIGGGAFGSVWEGYHKDNIQHKYAIKKVDMLDCIKKGKGEHNLQLIKNEVNVLAALKPLGISNIVAYVDFIEEPKANIFYIVMDLVKGIRLKEINISKFIANIEQYTYQIATGLKYIHMLGLVHRDIKPENLILNEECVVIVDLGLACQEKDIIENIITCSGEAGTKGYKDPSISIKGQTTSKSDIYSMGVCLYRILMGHKPRISTSSDVSDLSDSEYISELECNYKSDIRDIGKFNLPFIMKNLMIRMLDPINSDTRPSADDIMIILKPKIDIL